MIFIVLLVIASAVCWYIGFYSTRGDEEAKKYYLYHVFNEAELDREKYEKGREAYSHSPFDNDCAKALCIVFLVFAIIISIVALCINISAIGDNEEYKQTYTVLQYQLENGFYENIIENGKNDFYTQVLDYNKHVARGMKMQNNQFVGIFYPKKAYSGLELIELP